MRLSSLGVLVSASALTLAGITSAAPPRVAIDAPAPEYQIRVAVVSNSVPDAGQGANVRVNVALLDPAGRVLFDAPTDPRGRVNIPVDYRTLDTRDRLAVRVAAPDGKTARTLWEVWPDKRDYVVRVSYEPGRPDPRNDSNPPGIVSTEH